MKRVDPIDVADPFEFGRRLAYLRAETDISADALSARLDKRKGFVAWLESKQAENRPKSVNAKVAWEIAQTLAGRGPWTSDAFTLFRFLLCIDNDLSRLRAVTESARSRLGTARPVKGFIEEGVPEPAAELRKKETEDQPRAAIDGNLALKLEPVERPELQAVDSVVTPGIEVRSRTSRWRCRREVLRGGTPDARLAA